jgi:hypothetical protein
VLEFMADQGLVSLLCDDTMGVSRTVDLAFSSSPPLAPELAGDEVQLYYIVQNAHHMLEHEPDTTAHGFALWTDTGLVLAGIDGRFSVDSSLDAAWPSDLLTCGLASGNCLPRSTARANVRIGEGDYGAAHGGGFVAVGDYLSVVGTAHIEKADADLAESIDKETVRLLVGPPA